MRWRHGLEQRVGHGGEGAIRAGAARMFGVSAAEDGPAERRTAQARGARGGAHRGAGSPHPGRANEPSVRGGRGVVGESPAGDDGDAQRCWCRTIARSSTPCARTSSSWTAWVERTDTGGIRGVPRGTRGAVGGGGAEPRGGEEHASKGTGVDAATAQGSRHQGEGSHRAFLQPQRSRRE